MTGKILASSDYRLVITDRATRLGHLLAIGVGFVLAIVAVFGIGI